MGCESSYRINIPSNQFIIPLAFVPTLWAWDQRALRVPTLLLSEQKQEAGTKRQKRQEI
jgi:hypothetical protein